MKKRLNLFRLSIILIIICIISYTGVAVSLLASNFNLNDLDKLNMHFESNPKYSYNKDINLTENNSAESIENINLNFSTHNILVRNWDKNEISVSATGMISSNDSDNNIIINKEVVDHSLNFSLVDKDNTIVDHLNLYNVSITVYIPKNYNKKLNISSSVSNLRISSISLNSLTVKSISGNQELINVNAKNLSLNSTAGNINLNNVITESSDLTNVSGNIFGTNFSGNTHCKTLSGDIEMHFDKFNNDYSFSTISSTVTLSIPSNNNFSLDSNTTDGLIFNEFKENKSSKNKIHFDSISGNLNIHQI